MRKVEYYAGDGFEGVPEIGVFEIRAVGLKDKQFKNFDRAKKYYDSLNCGKAFWDFTRGAELLDAWSEIDEKDCDENEMPF